MFGYLTLEGAGKADALIYEAAQVLTAQGVRLAGVVQINDGAARDGRCHMDLAVLGTSESVRISQDLGPESRGCRLDPAGLERAVGLVAHAIENAPPPDLLVINKFGVQELEGRGFRPVIGTAMMRDIPVLMAVGPANLDGFMEFSGGLAEQVPSETTAIVDWVRRVVRPAA